MKWFTVEEKMPKAYTDYLVIQESGLMDVAWGCGSTLETFEWQNYGKKVLFYAKLPNRPKGFTARKMKKDFDIKMEQERNKPKEPTVWTPGQVAVMRIFMGENWTPDQEQQDQGQWE